MECNAAGCKLGQRPLDVWGVEPGACDVTGRSLAISVFVLVENCAKAELSVVADSS